MPGFWKIIKGLLGVDDEQESGAAQQTSPPQSSSSPPQPPPSSQASASSPSPQASPPRAGAAPAPKKDGPRFFTAPDILALSAEEFRKRALKIVPWQTAWIGRTDTIPPQSDERTALIDRGLILHGKLTQKEIAEIHEVGDLWLHYHAKVDMARVRAQESAKDAVEARRAEKAARKAQKKAESAEKKRLRAEAIIARKANDIIYLGRGVSSALGDRRSNVEKLMSLGLPVMAGPKDAAEFFGLTIPRLRWLAFHTEAAERTHYVYFEVPKRSGGTRMLAAPHRELARVQKKILTDILEKLDFGGSAHGFVKKRSTVTNARVHVGSNDIVNLDISDFFPTVGFRRVRGIFKSLGYSPAIATILALLTTEAPRVPVEYEGKKWMVAVGERALPQGAPTSPALSNLVSRRLDKRLAGLARVRGWRYTRYADDLTFSADAGKRDKIPQLIRQVEEILEKEGFRPHPKKRRLQRKGARQRVTGIVVNEKLSLPREEVRRLRAILHGAKKSGLESQNREARANFAAWLRGKLAYLAMVDPAKGRGMLAQLDEIEGRRRG